MRQAAVSIVSSCTSAVSSEGKSPRQDETSDHGGNHTWPLSPSEPKLHPSVEFFPSPPWSFPAYLSSIVIAMTHIFFPTMKLIIAGVAGYTAVELIRQALVHPATTFITALRRRRTPLPQAVQDTTATQYER